MRSKKFFPIAPGAAFFLLTAYLAMRLDGVFAWGAGDLLLAAALLFGAGLVYAHAARKSALPAYRAGMGLALASALLLIWGNLALGIIGSEDHPANRMYFGVLAMAVIGAVLSRLQAQGMARALFAAALAQVFVTVIALAAWKDLEVFEVLVLNAFFAALWAGSAALFLLAGRAGVSGRKAQS